MHEGRRFRATVEYEGTGFSGFQIQPGPRTVQGELEAALGRIFDCPTRALSAGRTDAGVHATAQEIAFDAPPGWTPGRLRDALGGVLPEDVRIGEPRETDAEFHPRFRATGRRYEYYVGTGGATGSPLWRRRLWIRERVPESDLLREAARRCLGRHDFSALGKAVPARVEPRCCLERAEWTAVPGGPLRLTLVADRFLRHMVRYLVRVMVEIGTGVRRIDEMSRLVQGDPGVRPPAPAPPHGLYLTGVRFAEGWNREAGVPGLWPASWSPRPHPEPRGVR